MIDIGSNTIRMAIYQIEGDRVELVMKQKHNVSLASYIHNEYLQHEGIEKTIDILCEYRDFLAAFGIMRRTALTAAALRNIRNSGPAVGEIEYRTGMSIKVLSGDEEATYDFIGATHNLDDESGLLIDIGGGSTEIVYFKNREIQVKVSLPIGSRGFHVRYTDKRNIFPSKRECDNMRAEAEATVGAIREFQAISHAQIAGIGGTFKGALALYNSMYGLPTRNKRLEIRRIPDMLWRFQREHELTQQDAILLMRTVPDRLRTFMPGLIIADALANRFGSSDIIYSDSGVREGFLYDQIVDKEEW